jgi:2,3-bisphosphoglycerate-dependent phosphoglycerate mutase
MPISNRHALLLVTFLSVCNPLFAQNGEITTFVLVRHAEKMKSADKNPPLTERGKERALNLASVLSEIDIDVIYSTNYLRTINTAKPLADAMGIEVMYYEPGNYDNLAKDWIEKHAGQNLFISGHSNTTPRIVNALLGRDDHLDLDEKEYDWVYIVDVTHIGAAKVKKLKIKIN